MRIFWVFTTCLLTLAFSSSAFAIGFTNLDQSEFKEIITEFGANFTHTSVSPAPGLGNVFGVEVGLVFGVTTTDEVNRIAKELEPDTDFEQMAHGGILVAVSFPLGITGEVIFLPEISNADVDLSTGSVAAKWTFSQFLELPLDLAGKLHVGSSNAKWNQTVSSTASSVEYKQRVSGLMLQASKNFGMVEPYLSFGAVKVIGEMASATGTVFDSAYSSSSSSEEQVSGTQTNVGLNVNLLVMKLGLEVGKTLDVTRTTFKTSFFF